MRGEKEGHEYAILTAEITKATFGLPSEHIKLKGLENENLRDHMSNLELVFTALGEDVTRRITRIGKKVIRKNMFNYVKICIIM